MATPLIKYFLRGLLFFIVSTIAMVFTGIGQILQGELLGHNLLILLWIPIIIMVYGWLITWTAKRF